jgi:riboflavin synthase
MFSGIIETQSRVQATRLADGLIFIDLKRPPEFDDIHIGDSIATSGVCLTIESFDEQIMTFALGAETLAITGWTATELGGMSMNLERSLKLGDRIHGHMVSGHVDAVGEIVSVKDLGGSTEVRIRAPKSVLRAVWKKGGWAVNGVSLTVNEVDGDVVSQCLIPETLRRTNLGTAQTGARVNLEIDMMARGLIQFLEAGIESGSLAALLARIKKED